MKEINWSCPACGKKDSQFEGVKEVVCSCGSHMSPQKIHSYTQNNKDKARTSKKIKK